MTIERIRVTKMQGRPPSPHRSQLAAYITAKRHVIIERRVKSVAQIARETGILPSTVRRWLKTDHSKEWLYWWLPMVFAPDLESGDCDIAALDLPDPDAFFICHESEDI